MRMMEALEWRYHMSMVQGDATNDGKVNIDDLGALDFAVSTGEYNPNCDFNYDDKLNIDDYGIIDWELQNQLPANGTMFSGAPGIFPVMYGGVTGSFSPDHLGPHGDESFTLQLDNLPAHNSLRVLANGWGEGDMITIAGLEPSVQAPLGVGASEAWDIDFRADHNDDSATLTITGDGDWTFHNITIMAGRDIVVAPMDAVINTPPVAPGVQTAGQTEISVQIVDPLVGPGQAKDYVIDQIRGAGPGGNLQVGPGVRQGNGITLLPVIFTGPKPGLGVVVPPHTPVGRVFWLKLRVIDDAQMKSNWIRVVVY